MKPKKRVRYIVTEDGEREFVPREEAEEDRNGDGHREKRKPRVRDEEPVRHSPWRV